MFLLQKELQNDNNNLNNDEFIIHGDLVYEVTAFSINLELMQKEMIGKSALFFLIFLKGENFSGVSAAIFINK